MAAIASDTGGESPRISNHFTCAKDQHFPTFPLFSLLGVDACTVSGVAPSIRDKAVLLVSCPDRRGIVAALAQVLYGHGANILDADQHTDADTGHFFQRILFDGSELHTDRLTLQSGIDEVAARFDMKVRLRYLEPVPRVAVFVSKYEHCLYDLFLRHRAGELSCELPLVLSNHPDLEDVARHFGAEYHHLPIASENKREQEKLAHRHLLEHRIDLIVLARYMQVLTPEFVKDWKDAIINIHHSFLPAFVGPRPYHQAHARGVKVIGATAHYVTADLDEGPIIDQGVAPTSHRDSVGDLVRKGRDLERLVLSNAVRAHLESRVLVQGSRTVVFGG
jgi:formyltetrahydrofolate deformylase